MCEIECFLIDETRTRMSQAWWGGKADPRQALPMGVKMGKRALLSRAPEKKRLPGVFVSFGKLP